MNAKTLHIVAFSLAMIGALNWGLVGLLNFNLVETIVGSGLSKIIYILIGVCAVYIFATHQKDCRICNKSK